MMSSKYFQASRTSGKSLRKKRAIKEETVLNIEKSSIPAKVFKHLSKDETTVPSSSLQHFAFKKSPTKTPSVTDSSQNIEKSILSVPNLDVNQESDNGSEYLTAKVFKHSSKDGTAVPSSSLQHFAFKKSPTKTQSVTDSTQNIEKSISSVSNLDVHQDSDDGSEYLTDDDCEAIEAGLLKKGTKLTPLEKQYQEFKKQYPDAILVMECGYKYRIFNEDSKIASKELDLGCFKYHSSVSTTFPVHRLNVHVSRLVSKGYKVGVIKQTETAALKAIGDNKSGLFSRKLHALYTKSTLIGEEFALPALNTDEECIDVGSGYLSCICEEKILASKENCYSIAVVTVRPSSGDLFYSAFEDTSLKAQLDSCLVHINPSEVLCPSSGLSKETENLLDNLLHKSMGTRIEKLDKDLFDYSLAIERISKFLIFKDDNEISESNDGMQVVVSLPPLVLCCLSALITYLSDFKLEKVLKDLANIQPFASFNEHMSLSAVTLKNLEIFQNNANGSKEGSLFWVLNKTITKFGERMLRLWVSKPLKHIEKINEKLDIINEIVCSESVVFNMLEKILNKLPDIEKKLCSAFFHKCSCLDFLILVQVLISIKNNFQSIHEKVMEEVKSGKVKTNVFQVLTLLDGIEKFEVNINPEAARENDKTNLFVDTSMYLSIEQCKAEMTIIDSKFNNLGSEICKIFSLSSFNYKTVSGQKYLIEVPNKLLHLVPKDWLLINMTKQMTRYRSPEVIILLNELERQQALLVDYCNEAWDSFLTDFETEFFKYKRAISYLAELDCFLSFAKVAKDESYCRPIISSDNQKMNIIQGRNPITIKLMTDNNQFVANNTNLNSDQHCMIITGPNMGGKSTYVRQVAHIAIMAHLGSYVPADCAEIPLLDGIYVRMGADDDLIHHRSTFMTEMCETSDILSSATNKSLVILDELGRGTSTHDGTAIAYATLEYLIREVKCLTLFVTHYPQVVELQKSFPENVILTHMDFILNDTDDDDIDSVTFLYSLVNGINEQSYGINVAALAGIPKDLLLLASKKSSEFQHKVQSTRKLQSIIQKLMSVPDLAEKLKSLKQTAE